MLLYIALFSSLHLAVQVLDTSMLERKTKHPPILAGCIQRTYCLLGSSSGPRVLFQIEKRSYIQHMIPRGPDVASSMVSVSGGGGEVGSDVLPFLSVLFFIFDVCHN